MTPIGNIEHDTISFSCIRLRLNSRCTNVIANCYKRWLGHTTQISKKYGHAILKIRISITKSNDVDVHFDDGTRLGKNMGQYFLGTKLAGIKHEVLNRMSDVGRKWFKIQTEPLLCNHANQ